ncbi:MAG: hypothetical protein MUF73_04955 [Rhodobacteraceae bacterium]|jgi:hypothetical protein|nr:hypothetical protein [Paracoccaceae bacterium]
MKMRALAGTALALVIAANSVQAGGLAAPEVESEVFGVEQPAVAAGGLGGAGTLAVIAALVLIAAVASGGDDNGDNDTPPPLN